MIDPEDVIRGLNAGTAAIVFIWYGVRSHQRWGNYEYAVRLYTWVLLFYSFSTMTGSLWGLWKAPALNPFIFFYILSNITFLLTLMNTREKQNFER